MVEDREIAMGGVVGTLNYTLLDGIILFTFLALGLLITICKYRSILKSSMLHITKQLRESLLIQCHAIIDDEITLKFELKNLIIWY